MKSQNKEQKLTEGQSKVKKPRFKIEKLEERIAPRCSARRCYHGGGGGVCHTNPQGKMVGPC